MKKFLAILFLLFLLFSKNTYAQSVTPIDSDSATANCSGTSGATFSIDVVSGGLLVIGEGHFDPSGLITTTINIGADTATTRGNYNIGGAIIGNYRYWYPTSTTTVTLSVTYSGNVSGDCYLGAQSFSTVHQSATFGTLSTTSPNVNTHCDNSPSGGSANGYAIQFVFGNGNTLSWSNTQSWEQETIQGGSGSAGMQIVAGASASFVATLGSNAANACFGDVIFPSASASTVPRLLLLGVGNVF